MEGARCKEHCLRQKANPTFVKQIFLIIVGVFLHSLNYMKISIDFVKCLKANNGRLKSTESLQFCNKVA